MKARGVLLMFGLSIWEVAMILVVALLVLGPQRLPAVIRSLSKAMHALQRTSSDVRRAIAEPLREVREPLERMRDDIYDTVGTIEREMDESGQVLMAGPDPTVETPDPAGSPAEESETADDSEAVVEVETETRPPKAKA